LIKFIFVTLFLLLTLEARENPFFPSFGQKEIMYSSNQDNSLPPLKRATITLPATARTIESITVNFKNLDGSIEKKSIELANSIDWHLPLFISQSYIEQKDTKEIKTAPKERKYTKIATIKYATFFASEKLLKIDTKDEMLRNFLLVKPHRIVLDFKRDTNMKSYIKSNPKNIFKKIRVGNHDGYYRVVIELDGYYRYKFVKTADGYEFSLQ
jgi:hypothetical protein